MPRAMNVAAPKKAAGAPRKGRQAKSPVSLGAGPTKAKRARATTSKASAVPMKGTFNETFYNVSDMDMVGERSETKIIGGYPWRLWMCRYGGGDHQLFIECCQNEETPVWHADFDAKITFADAGYGCRFIERKTGETVSQARWLVRAEQLSHYMDKNIGIEEDPIDSDEEEEPHTVDYVSVEVEITVKEAKGDRFRPKPTIDIYTPNEEMYDCELAIGDKNIQVNKQYLAFHSVFFKDLFFGKKDEDKKEAKVDGVTPEDFALLLGYLYRIEDTITVDNWEKLAKMGLQFQMQDVKDSIEYWVMDHYEVAIWSNAKKLAVADKYGMESYQEMTLAELSSDYYVKQVKESEEWKEFSKEMKEQVEKKEEELKKKK